MSEENVELTRRRLINPDGLFEGVPYSYIAVAPDGGTVFTAGACPIDAQGCVVEPGDIPAQTRRTLDNLAVALGAGGCSLGDVLKTTVYVASAEHADLLAAWAVVEEDFGTDGPPSTLLGVAALGFTGQLVEIEAVAALPAASG
jgi:enamine deaminase RidA (YjgF/YER057c/UK114 family)